MCVYIRNIWYNLQYDEIREGDVYHWPVDFNQRGRVHHLVTKTKQAEHAHFIIRIYNNERKLDQNTKNSKIYKRVRVTVCVFAGSCVYYDKNFVYWINKGFLPIKYYVEFISSSNKQQVCLYRPAHLCGVCVCINYFSAFIQKLMEIFVPCVLIAMKTMEWKMSEWMNEWMHNERVALEWTELITSIKQRLNKK